MMTRAKCDAHDPARAWCTVVLWVIAMFHACVAAGALIDEPSQLRLPAGSTRSAPSAALRVYGLPLRVETFRSPADLQTTAAAIARQLDAPPSLLVQAGVLVLTWQSGPQHWVVRLTQQAAPRTYTHGTVSVLTLLDDAVPQAGAAPVWLPADAKLRFTMDDGNNTNGKALQRHSLYTYDLPPSRLWPLLLERLHLAGWSGAAGQSESGAMAHGGALHVTRGPHSLTLMVVAASGGSGVLALETIR